MWEQHHSRTRCSTAEAASSSVLADAIVFGGITFERIVEYRSNTSAKDSAMTVYEPGSVDDVARYQAKKLLNGAMRRSRGCAASSPGTTRSGASTRRLSPTWGATGTRARCSPACRRALRPARSASCSRAAARSTTCARPQARGALSPRMRLQGGAQLRG